MRLTTVLRRPFGCHVDVRRSGEGGRRRPIGRRRCGGGPGVGGATIRGPGMTSGPSAYGGICARCGVEVERVSWADDSNVFTAA